MQNFRSYSRYFVTMIFDKGGAARRIVCQRKEIIYHYCNEHNALTFDRPSAERKRCADRTNEYLSEMVLILLCKGRCRYESGDKPRQEAYFGLASHR